MTTGYVFKAQYYLPINASEFRPQYPFFPLELKRRFQRDLEHVENMIDSNSDVKFEHYDGKLTEISTDQDHFENKDDAKYWDEDNLDDEDDLEDDVDVDEIPWKSEVHTEKIDSSNSRWNLYKGIERIASE